MLSLAVAAVILSVVFSWFLAAIRGWRARNRQDPSYFPPFAPSVSILIPAWNERAMLGQCIARLKRLDYLDWECIIIAGGQDHTFEYAQEVIVGSPNFKVIPQRPAGKNAALNDGLRLSRGGIVALLDADCEVEPDWLSALVAPLAQNAGASVSNFFPNPITPIALQFEMNKISSYQVRGTTTLHGGAIALQRNVIDQLGGSFPEDVWVGTDWDLNNRLERLGIKKVFVPSARHRTPFPSTWAQFTRNEIRWRRALFHAILRSWRTSIRDMVLNGMLLIPYVVGILLVSLPPAMLIIFLLDPVVSVYLAWSWFLYLSWVLGRRVGQVIEVMTYKNNWRWLKLFWVPPTTLIISLICCIPALMSLSRFSPHFQGYRPPISFEKEHG